MADDVDVLPGTLEFLVLKALSWGPRHGYAIARWLRDTTAEALSVEEGALYPALHRLERQGLVSGRWGKSEHNHRVKHYTLTDNGRRELQRRAASWTRYVGVVGQVMRANA
jgi:PadR family transcriptional regulator, regulatory protein PadR